MTYVIALKEQRGVKHSTIVRYKVLAARIYPAIGHIKLKDLRADHLNSLYTMLGQAGNDNASAIAKADLASVLKAKNITRVELAEKAKVSLRTVYGAVKGEPVSLKTAQAISKALEVKLEQVQ